MRPAFAGAIPSHQDLGPNSASAMTHSAKSIVIRALTEDPQGAAQWANRPGLGAPRPKG